MDWAFKVPSTGDREAHGSPIRGGAIQATGGGKNKLSKASLICRIFSEIWLFGARLEPKVQGGGRIAATAMWPDAWC
jgi:hypothetical protein